MNIQELLKCAEAYRQGLDRLALVKEDLADLEQITKERSGLTNMELRAFKRILKAEHKDQLDKLDEQTEAQTYLRDVLTDKKVVDKKVVAIPHDPQTGEIIQSADDKTADVAPDSVAISSVKSPPQENGQGRDSLSNELPSAHPFEGERGASAPSHDDVSRVQDGPVKGIGATNYGNPSHQSPNEIIPAMPACLHRSTAE